MADLLEVLLVDKTLPEDLLVINRIQQAQRKGWIPVIKTEVALTTEALPKATMV